MTGWTDKNKSAKYKVGALVSVDLVTGIATIVDALVDDGTYDDPLADPSYPTIYYNNITALDADSAGVLWGIGYQVDIRPDFDQVPNPTPPPANIDVPNPPDAANDGEDPPNLVPVLFQLQMDPVTGEPTTLVTYMGTLSPDDSAYPGISFDSSDNLYAVEVADNGNEYLSVLSPLTGPVVGSGRVGQFKNAFDNSIITGFTALEFDDAGTLYGVANNQLWIINPADAKCTLTGPQIGGDAEPQFIPMSGLSYDPTYPDYLWGIFADGGNDALVRIYKDPPKPADPFSIYVAEGDAYTEILTSVVIPYKIDNVWYYDDVRLWNAPGTPCVAYDWRYTWWETHPPYTPPPGVIIPAPEHTGGVIIGSLPASSPTMPYIYAAVTDEFPLSPGPASALGVFPGGDRPGPLGNGYLYGGITVAEQIERTDLTEVLGDAPDYLGYRQIYSLAATSGGAFYTVTNQTGELLKIDPTTGTTADHWALSIAYGNVRALDFDGTDTLWAAGNRVSDAALMLIQISIAGGSEGTVTEVAPITDGGVPVINIMSLAFEPGSGDLYAIRSDTDTDTLITIDKVSGAVTTIGTLFDPFRQMQVLGVRGIDFTGNGTLYGVAQGDIYLLNPANADTVLVITTDVRTGTALAFDPTRPSYLWTIENLAGAAQLVRIDMGFVATEVGTGPGWTGYDDLSSLAASRDGLFVAFDNETDELIEIDPATGAGSSLGALLDKDANAYDEIYALDFDPRGRLWAIGEKAGGGLPRLLLIDPVSYEVRPLAFLAGISNVPSIAFDAYGNLYGIDGDSDDLVIFDTDVFGAFTGTVSVLGGLLDTGTWTTVTGMEGIDFDGAGNLYGVAQGVLWRINLDWALGLPGECTMCRDVNIDGLAALAFDLTQQRYIWAIERVGDESEADRLVRIDLGYGQNLAEVGWVLVGGTLAGRTTIPNSIEVLQVGMLYGSVDVRGDMRTFYCQGDAGGFYSGANFLPIYINPYTATFGINVQGTLGDVYVGGGFWELGGADYQHLGQEMEPGIAYGSVYAAGLAGIPDPTVKGLTNWNNQHKQPILELEGRLPEVFAQKTGFGMGFYHNYTNIIFTTARPLIGDYATVLLTDNVGSILGLMGIAQSVDPLNSDLNDMCVAFLGEVATYYNADLGYDFDQITTAIANLASHELGHILGLNHIQDDTVGIPHIIMGYHPALEELQEFTGALDSVHPRMPLMMSPSTEFLIGYQDDNVLLRVIA